MKIRVIVRSLGHEETKIKLFSVLNCPNKVLSGFSLKDNSAFDLKKKKVNK